MLAINYEADLARAESDLPQAVTINGTDYSACVSEAQRGQSLDMAGVLGDCDLNATIRTSVLASVAIGTRITFNGKVYRVEKVNDSPCGYSYRLDCVDVSR